jgi:aminodeoxychorismate lyase
MLVFLNGKFVPEEQAVVSVFDRSFLYGDGLFETLRVAGGKPFCWPQHIERLQRGAEFLKLRLPFAREALEMFSTRLIEQNQMPESLLRITLSRGIGPRSYSPVGANQPFLVMSLHAAPQIDLQKPMQWRLYTSSVRLPATEPLAQFKTCNKLPQILARAEAEAAGADEGLLLNTDGMVAEAASSNIFWLKDGIVGTPPLASGILAGVTRIIVLQICQELRLPCQQLGISPKALLQMDGAFLSLSSLGVVEALTLDRQPLQQSALTATIRDAYHSKLTAKI